MISVRYSSGNSLLDSLPAHELDDLEKDVKIVTLKAREFTHSRGTRMEQVDFPIDAVLSVVALLHMGDTVEVGTVGRESFVEADAALDSSIASRTAFCQVRGRVGRMSIERFQQRLQSEAFALAIHRNVRATLFCTQQFTACNAKHTFGQRCARWLAMTADRVGRIQFVLSAEFLAIMIGIPTSNVLEMVRQLKESGAIEYVQGVVTVLDRTKLENATRECYAACRDAFVSSLMR